MEYYLPFTPQEQPRPTTRHHAPSTNPRAPPTSDVDVLYVLEKRHSIYPIIHIQVLVLQSTTLYSTLVHERRFLLEFCIFTAAF